MQNLPFIGLDHDMIDMMEKRLSIYVYKVFDNNLLFEERYNLFSNETNQAIIVDYETQRVYFLDIESGPSGPTLFQVLQKLELNNMIIHHNPEHLQNMVRIIDLMDHFLYLYETENAFNLEQYVEFEFNVESQNEIHNRLDIEMEIYQNEDDEDENDENDENEIFQQILI